MALTGRGPTRQSTRPWGRPVQSLCGAPETVAPRLPSPVRLAVNCPLPTRETRKGTRACCARVVAAQMVVPMLVSGDTSFGFQGRSLNVLEYQVPAGWACLADLFQVLEDSKAAGSIRHYALAQAPLEQVGRPCGGAPAPRPPPGPLVPPLPRSQAALLLLLHTPGPASRLPFAHSYPPQVGRQPPLPLAFLSTASTGQ